MYSKTPIKDRIRQFVSYLGHGNKPFEVRCHLSNGWVGIESEPTTKVLVQIMSEYPQLSPDWILCGTGPMLRSLREHPSVITATVPVDSSAGKDTTNETFADLDDPNVQAALNPFGSVAEPTQPYRAENPRETITIPLVVWEQLRKQLENKDAQIATLLTAIQH